MSQPPRLRIAYICSEYPPVPHGGIGTFTQVIARAMVRRGHDVRVIGSYGGNGSHRAPIVDEGVQVERLPQARGRIGWVAGRFRIYRRVARLALAGRIDIVEMPDWGGAGAWWPPLPVPLIVRLHGSSTYFVAESGRTPHRFTLRVENASLQRATRMCAVSEYTARSTQHLFHLPGEVPTVLYNPVDVPPEPLPFNRRDRWRVVYAGTLTPKKGIERLIAAWPAIHAASPSATLDIYGKDGVTTDGSPMQASLERRIPPELRSTVRFHGHVLRASVLAAFNSARVAVFPSMTESFGLTAAEAMAAGCPTVFTRRSSGPEVLRDGEEGRLVDPGDERSIAGAVIELLTDDAAARRCSESGRRGVTERFEAAKVVARNEEFYAQCVDDFRRGIS
jgi:glycosyltransferase involved in cell wall biosynthesis